MEDTGGISDQCMTCGWLDRPPRKGDGKTFTCMAFPDGIPEEIISGNFDHTAEYDGDRGLRYIKDPDAI